MSIEQQVGTFFEQQFGSQPQGVFYSPGRVNLIGDHTDYNDGFVLPAAINFGTYIAASARTDRQIQVAALDYDGELKIFDLDSIAFDSQCMWVNYIAGSMQALMGEHTFNGANLVIAGNVPQGAGLSSSASLEMAVLNTMAQLYNLDLVGVRAAQLGQLAENNFVGCNCGIMDQLISAMGKVDHAMLLDCRALTFEDAPISDNLAIVIINSNVKRGLVDSEYNTRRQQCEAVAQQLGVAALRDVTQAMLEAHSEQIAPTNYRRARHVISENKRAQAMLSALTQGDMQRIGELMLASHRSLKDDFEVTTPELDYLVELVTEQLDGQGGARMTGGGFGGCVVALVNTDLVEQVRQTVEQHYTKRFGLKADIYLCTASQGAFREK